MTWPSLASGWSGILAFAFINGWCLSTLLVLVGGLLTTLWRGRWSGSPPRYLGFYAAVVISGLLASLLLDSTFPEFYLGLGLVVGQCGLFLCRMTPREEAIASASGVALTLLCAFASPLGDQSGTVLLSLCIAAQVACLAVGARLRMMGRGLRWSTALAILASLCLSVMLGVLLGWTETGFNRLATSAAALGGSSFFFPGASRLDTLLRGQNNPAVVLRYWSVQPPRYLVGNCYVTYEARTWKTRGHRVVINGEPLAEHVYAYDLTAPTPSEKVIQDRVEMAGGLSLFHPRDALQVRLRSPILKRRFGDTFESSLQGGYSGAYEFSRIPEALPRSLWSAPAEAVYLQLPPELSPSVARMAANVTTGVTDQRRRALALEAFLQENYRYGFDYPFSKSADPVADFLEKKPPAHCELFASALALMLRTQGIPARYINGFIVVEKSRGDYRVVRARNAHAWVEAYIEGDWIRLDPTPPAAQESLSKAPTSLEKAVEWVAYRWSRLRNLDYRAILTQLRTGSRSGLGYVGLALLAVLLVRYRSRLRIAWSRRQPAAPREELPLLLERFEALAGAPRPAHVTLRRWALDWPEQTPGRRFLEYYSLLRYAGAESSTEPLYQILDQLEENLNIRKSRQANIKKP